MAKVGIVTDTSYQKWRLHKRPLSKPNFEIMKKVYVVSDSFGDLFVFGDYKKALSYFIERSNDLRFRKGSTVIFEDTFGDDKYLIVKREDGVVVKIRINEKSVIK